MGILENGNYSCACPRGWKLPYLWEPGVGSTASLSAQSCDSCLDALRDAGSGGGLDSILQVHTEVFSCSEFLEHLWCSSLDLSSEKMQKLNSTWALFPLDRYSMAFQDLGSILSLQFWGWQFCWQLMKNFVCLSGVHHQNYFSLQRTLFQ
jgi:hypothetical protein